MNADATKSWDRPPPDIALAELFEHWLPGAFAASGQRAPADTPLLRVSVSGTGGGAWELALDGDRAARGAARARAARHLDAPVGRRPARGAGRRRSRPAADRPARAGRRSTFLTVNPRDVDLVRQISGRVCCSRSRGAGGGGSRSTSGSARRASAPGGRARRCALDGADVRGAAQRRDPADAAALRRPAQDRGRSRAGDAANAAGREPARPALTAPLFGSAPVVGLARLDPPASAAGRSRSGASPDGCETAAPMASERASDGAPATPRPAPERASSPKRPGDAHASCALACCRRPARAARR